jgi:hypothetical protein
MTAAGQFRGLRAVDARAAVPLAVLTPAAMAQLELTSGMRVIVFFGVRRVAAWLCSTNEAPQQVPAGQNGDELVWLSTRARKLLQFPDGDQPLVELHSPASMVFEIAPAIVDDLPPANVVDLSRRDAAHFGKWALVYGKSIGMPVRVRSRRMQPGRVRMSMLTRTLGALYDGGRVRIARLDRERLHWRDELRGRTAVSWVVRQVAWMIELLLRRLFHAPALAMATVEAHLGDDTNRVVRISPQTFSVLGIRAGDDVLVEWADRRVVAVAHESFESSERELAVATLDTWGRDDEVTQIAKHLTIGIAAEMRGELRIPRRTVVAVRRRVSTIFLRRMNELTLPVGGLLLAAIAIQDFPLAYVAIGTVVITILAMLPARHRVPPRGRWP